MLPIFSALKYYFPEYPGIGYIPYPTCPYKDFSRNGFEKIKYELGQLGAFFGA